MARLAVPAAQVGAVVKKVLDTNRFDFPCESLLPYWRDIQSCYSDAPNALFGRLTAAQSNLLSDGQKRARRAYALVEALRNHRALLAVAMVGIGVPAAALPRLQLGGLRELDLSGNALGAHGLALLAVALAWRPPPAATAAEACSLSSSLKKAKAQGKDLAEPTAPAAKPPRASASGSTRSASGARWTPPSEGAAQPRGGKEESRAGGQPVRLRVLRLRDIGLLPTDGAPAATLLRTNDSLTELDLGWNHLGARGVRAVAKALRHNTSLRRLGLAATAMGDQGVTCLANALRLRRLPSGAKWLPAGVAGPGEAEGAAPVSGGRWVRSRLSVLKKARRRLARKQGRGGARASRRTRGTYPTALHRDRSVL